MSERITDVLATLARQPAAGWEAHLRASFPDEPELVRQGLLWLRADRDRASDADAPPSLGAGDARYELGLLLDAGATASVWQAHDRTLGRNVAIKVFRGSVDEILAEARAACEVASDHVVRVLDVHDDGTHRYIVMELIGEYDPQRDDLVPGRSAAICRPASVDEAVRWLIDVARGLHDAHLRNVFHRDLKPANVLITPLSRRARIADFGIAISADRVTSGGVRVAGTPEYMAPEQARGLPHGLSPHDVEGRQALVRVDVWGLGALAFDLLGGSPPWQATRESFAWEIAAAGERPAPPARTPAGERVPPRLRRVIDKAMASDPARRYATAAELGRELTAVLERRPTSLDRSPLLRVALWSRRNPQLTMTALGALALAAGVLAAYVSIRGLRAERAELAAEMTSAEVENQQLAARMRTTRAELERTEASLAQQARSLAEGQKEYQGIIDAKVHALHDADVATRRLVEQLGDTKSDRDVAEYGRSLYEGFWSSARKDVDRLTLERDQATSERDIARGERDQATKERDAARAARTQAETDRDAARAAADRANVERAAAQAELAQALHAKPEHDAGPADATP